MRRGEIYNLRVDLAAWWKPRVIFQWMPNGSPIGGNELALGLALRASRQLYARSIPSLLT